MDGAGRAVEEGEGRLRKRYAGNGSNSNKITERLVISIPVSALLCPALSGGSLSNYAYTVS